MNKKAMRDPYLIPGQICEEWEGGEEYRKLVYFVGYDRAGAFPLFCRFGNQDCDWVPLTDLSCYEPVGTEWKFAPSWAICSTVDKFGRIEFWSSNTPECLENGYWKKNFKLSKSIVCGICPDKSRYENGAWKTSLRMRPEWAKVE